MDVLHDCVCGHTWTASGHQDSNCPKCNPADKTEALIKIVHDLLDCCELNMDDMERSTRRTIDRAIDLLAECGA